MCCLFLAEFGIATVRPGATLHLCSLTGNETIRGSISRLCLQAHFWCGSCQVWSGRQRTALGSRVWSLPCHLPGPQCGRGACLCLCLSPVLADTGSAVSQAWKASPCLCRAASFQKSSLSHCGGTGEQTELCVTTDGQDQKYHSFDVHHEFPLLVPGWRAVRGRASGRQGRGVVAVNYSCSLQMSEEHPASLDRAELV